MSNVACGAYHVSCVVCGVCACCAVGSTQFLVEAIAQSTMIIISIIIK